MPRERRRRRRRGSSDGGNIFGEIAGAPLGLAGNLFGDVRDAVVGLPMGVVGMATHPIRGFEQIGRQYWKTYSPLFSGDFKKFGQNLYDHPLGPILDVATIFTLGAGSAARGAGALSKAGMGGAKTAKVAGLRTPRALEIADPLGKRLPQTYSLSTRAGRRSVQEARLAIEAHLPELYASPMQRMRFERLHTSDMAHRTVAKTFMLNNTLEAGKLLADDNPLAPRMRTEIAAGTHLQLMRHNPAIDAVEAKALVKGGHVNYITAPAMANRRHLRQLNKLQAKERRLDKVRVKYAEDAHALPKIEKELEAANAELKRLYDEGAHITMPASTSHRAGQTQRMEQEAGPVIDADRVVRDLEKRLEEARRAKTFHTNATHELGIVKPQRMDLETRSFKEYYENRGRSAQAFEDGMKDFGRWATTNDIRRAARTNDGRVYVVPKHDAYNLGLEAARSHAFVRHVWHNPTTLWKRLMIGWTPRSITNNFVGNWTIYALREGPTPQAAQALYDAVRFAKGERTAMDSFRAALPFKNDHWLYRYFGDELGDVFGRELLEDASLKDRAGKVATSGFYPIVHKLADSPVRVASIMAFMRKHPDVQRIMREQGVDFDKAARQALRTSRTIRDETVQHTRKTAGDYATLHGAEKVVRDLVPFYLWYRHIMRTGWNMTLETPGRLSVASRLSSLGIESTQELLGEIPEFLNGAIPLSVLGLDNPEKGRQDILLTASLNPFASLGEISSLVEAMTTGTGPRMGSATMGLNPFLTSFMEAATGTSLLSGAKKQTFGGVIPSVLKATAEGLPQIRTIEALLSEDTTQSAAGNELLFARDDRGPLTSLFGVPLRSLSEESAVRLAALEGGGQSTRRRRRRRRR